jgi:4-amino-4-deoxy-L-arabinose transferase-like glycosyltransferase
MNADQSWRSLYWGLVLLLALVAWLFWSSAPMNGDFGWSDAPRHALNGIFVLDLLREWPLQDPKGWAEGYYIQYPALSILFYPPLFSFVLAGAYAVFGFSHEVAQGTVGLFHFALMAGMYVLARRWLPQSYALGAALLLGAAPEVALWARQVMLDIPTFAWLIWSVIALFRYLRTERSRDLLVTTVLLLGALYTKQTAIFAVVPMSLLLLSSKGWRHLLSRQVTVSAVFFAVALVPLILLHLEFGAVNAASVLREPDAAPSFSIAAWAFYAVAIPGQLGWHVVLLCGVFLVLCFLRRRCGLPPVELVFLASWFLAGYVFFSLVMLRESRHDLLILWPVVLFAMLGLRYLINDIANLGTPRWNTFAPLVLGLTSVIWSLAVTSVPYVEGYREAVRSVISKAPVESNILFSGYRDGNFVFNVRGGHRDDLGVVRADKLLLRVAIKREKGVEVVETTRNQVLDYLRRYRIRYVVAQVDFWTDLESMALLQEMLADASLFATVDSIELRANYRSSDKVLRVYEYLGEILDEAEPLSLEMVGIGQTFSE